MFSFISNHLQYNRLMLTSRLKENYKTILKQGGTILYFKLHIVNHIFVAFQMNGIIIASTNV